MQSKPIKDWIPEFPALQRLIIPKLKKDKDRKHSTVKHNEFKTNLYIFLTKINN